MGTDNWLRHQNLSAVLNGGDFAAFHTLGENIIVAPGNFTPDQLEAVWWASPPHRANIVNGSYNVVGIGAFWGPDGRLWSVVDFGGL